MSVTLSLDDVYELAWRALMGSQVSDTNAHLVAYSIRTAEADGFHLAGLGHLPQYCADARPLEVCLDNRRYANTNFNFDRDYDLSVNLSKYLALLC